MSVLLLESRDGIGELDGGNSPDTRCPTTEEEWDVHRSRIEHLYLEEKKTLKEVMSVMKRDHGIKATIKMYKNRIIKWGLDKKNKEAEIKAIVRKKTVRAAIGKTSEFKLRGRLIDFKKVESYLKRRSLSIADIVLRRTSSAPTPPALDCLTPTEIPSSLRLSEVFEIPERIFVSIRDYFLGSFGAGTWIVQGEVSDCVSIKRCGNEMTALKTLFSQHDVACQLFDKGSFDEGGRVLVNASAGIKDILLAEHPRTVGALFDLVMYLRRRERAEVANMLLQQFAALATVILPTNHPLGQICTDFVSLDATRFQNVVITAWQSALDCFGIVLGPMHYSTLRSRLEYIQMAESIQGLERAEMMLKRLVYQCKGNCGLTDVRTLKLLDTLGEILLDQGKFAEAEEIAEEIISSGPHVKPRSKSVDVCVAGLFIIARAQYHDGRTGLAEDTLRRAIDLNVSEWGWGHALTLKYLVQLEGWLMECGDQLNALQIKQKRARILEASDSML